MEWSTKPHQSDQPFGSWADDLAAAFVRLEPRKIAEHPFEGTISRADAAPIQISRVTATKHRVLRFARTLRAARMICALSTFSSKGWAATRSAVIEQICGPGDLAVADTTEPFEIANWSRFQAVLFCRAATFAAASFLRAPAADPVRDRSRPRSLPNARRLCRALS